MKDPILLIDAILDSYDRIDYRPNPDGTTHCNQAVNSIATTLGYTKLVGMTADQMVAFFPTSDDWSDITDTEYEEIQDMANEGSLIVAGLDGKSLNQGHGHVVVIRPGRVCFSGKWGKTPRVVNVGGSNFIARGQTGVLTNQPCGLNEAFIPAPKIWVLRSTL